MNAFASRKLDAIYHALQARITSGRWPVDAHIPTERELAEEFDCSRGTMGRAIAQLVREGFLERRTRVGTRVISRNPLRESAIDFDACAFIHPSQQHEGVWRTASGFQQAAGHAKCRTLMLSTGTDFRKEAEIIGRLAEFDVKGAVLFPVILAPEDMAFYTQMILACRFPVVMVELNIAGMGRPAVVADGLHAGYTMTKHLIRKGAKKIGFLGNYAWAPVVREKYLGYRQAMEEAGLLIDGRAHLDPAMTPCFDDPLREPTELARTYLQRHRDVEAVVCSLDFLAVGVIHAARELGLRVPHDLKVAGIDDYALAAAHGLTTYRVPCETIGARAFEVLSGILAGRAPAVPEIQIRGELVARQSA